MAPTQMRCHSSWGALLGIMLGNVAHADALDRARIAAVAGSERLQMFAYGKLLETGDAPRAAIVQMKKSMVSQGFYYEPGTNRMIASEAWASPILSYDGNINGGVLQNGFTMAGFYFEADPASRAKAGVVTGLSAGSTARLAWANGRYVDGRLRVEAVWSPEHRMGRSNAELALCSRNHVTGWSFVDLCHITSALERELGSSVSQATKLDVTQLFQIGTGYHEVKAELALGQYDSGDQSSVTLTWAAVWNKAATKLSVTKAAPITGETALDNRIAADVKWLWHGRAIGIGLWHQRAAGGDFLGMARVDQAIGINLSYQLRPGLTAQLGYIDNESSVDFFDYAQPTASVQFDALRW